MPQKRTYWWMFSAGRLTRGRTVICIDRDYCVQLSTIVDQPRWSVGVQRSAADEVLSQLSISIASTPVSMDDVPWCPELEFASPKVRDLLAFCEDQVVWAPARLTGVRPPSAAECPYFALLPVHVIGCGKALPRDPGPLGRVRFEVDVDKVPEGIDIFRALEKPGKVLVSDQVKEAIERARIKKVFFVSPDKKGQLW